MKWNTGTKNGNWKGGRTITSSGYVGLRVPPGHHLRMRNGYAYEHRLVAEQKLGRWLRPGEIPHHIDGNKLNNAPDNIEIVSSAAEHFFHHRMPSSNIIRTPGEKNPSRDCACGCGRRVSRYDQHGRLRLFLSGHNPQPSPTIDAVLAAMTEPRLRRSLIAARAGLSARGVAVVLSRLKKKGVVRSAGHGLWERV